MNCGSTSRSITVSLLAGMYLFVVLFSQLFHNHPGVDTRQPVHGAQGKTLMDKALRMSSDHCLSCHLLHDFHGTAPEFFSFEVKNQPAYRLTSAERQFVYLYRLKEIASLRGPPSWGSFV